MNVKKLLRKRYIFPAAIFLTLMPVSRMQWFKFRMSDEQYVDYMEKRKLPVPEFHDYDYEGRNIHYVKVGEDQKPLVVFVHGSPGSSSACANFLASDTVRQVAQAITVDRPGFGYSGFGIPERSLEKQSLALKKAIENHRKNKVILVGHSYGGPLIARMAMDYPELIDGLIMVAPSIDPDLEPKYWWQQPLNWISGIIPPAFIVSNKEIIALEEELRKMMPLWEKITQKVIVIQGDEDTLVPAGNAAFAKKMLVNAKKLDIRMVPKGDHFIFWSRKQMVEKAIMDLISNG